jgi:hypothetical protein
MRKPISKAQAQKRCGAGISMAIVMSLLHPAGIPFGIAIIILGICMYRHYKKVGGW